MCDAGDAVIWFRRVIVYITAIQQIITIIIIILNRPTGRTS